MKNKLIGNNNKKIVLIYLRMLLRSCGILMIMALFSMFFIHSDTCTVQTYPQQVSTAIHILILISTVSFLETVFIVLYTTD